MANTQRNLAVLMLAAGTFTSIGRAAGQDVPAPASTLHARSEQPYLAALIQDGIARSETFAHVVDALNHTDVVAYLDSSARMRAGFDGYLLHRVRAAGGLRYVHVIVRTGLVRDRLISTIAHELQHVLEVAESPAQTDDALKDWLEHLDAGSCLSTCVETAAAEQVQEAVFRELHQKKSSSVGT
jgi:hypothetical protein